jgi:Na+/H+ antiporter NhaD/arsenite permease-like protein
VLIPGSNPCLASSGVHMEPHAVWVSFFVLLLLSIAVLPLVVEHWWESNRNKSLVAAALSVPVASYYLFSQPAQLLHPMEEYFSFIVLLWSLYTISGGIVLRGAIKGTPRANTILLLLGAVIANVFGTTGAAMLLIRPLLRMNAGRKFKKHIVIFFIFLVANVGGCLTPLGDPPLFLGYLRGVPFEWTLKLFPIWAPTLAVLLVIFYAWDVKAWRKEDILYRKLPPEGGKFAIAGNLNFLLVGGVMCATVFSPQLQQVSDTVGLGWGGGSPWRELIMIAMGIISMYVTPKAYRTENRFNFDAIIEVAVLFAGIFITMIPALSLLEIHGAELGLSQPWHFMWATGILSSFLDNAPTYLVFASAATSVAQVPDIASLVSSAVGEPLLKAVSIGAVFMGANTYIGNAPNFMVKVIADTAREQRVRMPSFFGYMLYSIVILMPVYIIVTAVAFIALGSFL